MDHTKLKDAFSKIKEEINVLNLNVEDLENKNKKINSQITELKNKKQEIKEENPTNEVETLKLQVKELQKSFENYGKDNFETLDTIQRNFETRLQEEISSIRLELMDIILERSKEKSPGNEFMSELQEFNR